MKLSSTMANGLVRRDLIGTRDTSPNVLLIQMKPDPLLLLKY